MSAHYPRVRIETEDGNIRAREGLDLTFYMPPCHPESAEKVLSALDIYLRYVGTQALTHYADMEGYWQDLGDSGWNLTRRELRERVCTVVTLKELSRTGSRYFFHYDGRDAEFPIQWNQPDAMSGATFWLPSEYLEEHGPGKVRELTLELATSLPVRFGFCGLAFLGDIGMKRVDRQLQPYWKRHPGFDVPDSSGHSLHIGARTTGPHWVNILGQPVLGELGGVSGLRERLKSLETTVQELAGDKAVITLGPWPQAGDTERGDRLPAYRELARVLEPWLYQKKRRIPHVSEEESRRWERRFLD
jgi:hypothetical protein